MDVSSSSILLSLNLDKYAAHIFQYFFFMDKREGGREGGLNDLMAENNTVKLACNATRARRQPTRRFFFIFVFNISICVRVYTTGPDKHIRVGGHAE